MEWIRERTRDSCFRLTVRSLYIGAELGEIEKSMTNMTENVRR